jgi:hypothetical protein
VNSGFSFDRPKINKDSSSQDGGVLGMKDGQSIELGGQLGIVKEEPRPLTSQLTGLGLRRG